MLINRILIQADRLTQNSADENKDTLISLRSDYLSMSDLVGQIRGLGAGYITSGRADPSTAGDIRVLSELLASRVASTDNLASNLSSSQMSDINRAIQSANQDISAYLALVARVLKEPNEFNAGNYFDQGSQVIEGMGQVLDSTSNRLDTEISDSISTANQSAWSLSMIVAFMIFVVTAAFAGVVRHINRQISIVGGDIARAATGQLAVVSKPRGRDEFASLRIHFAEAMVSVSSLVQDIRGAESNLGTYLRFFIGNVEKCEGEVREQNADLAEIASNTQSLGQDSTSLFEQTKELNQACKASDKSSTEAKQSALASVQHIESLHSSISNAVADMAKLIERSKEIDDVVEVIQAIAEQTNLLALNAAIEAARAGEQGRGFAVVADEVRTLASRTQSSTGQIGAIVSNLQREFTTMSEVVSKNAEAVAGAVEQAQVTDKSCEEINQQISQLSQVSKRITEISSKQSKEAQEISENLSHLSTSRESVYGTLESTIKNSADVIATLEQLSRTTSRFALEDRGKT